MDILVLATDDLLKQPAPSPSVPDTEYVRAEPSCFIHLMQSAQNGEIADLAG